jgi:hypothetical protein
MNFQPNYHGQDKEVQDVLNETNDLISEASTLLNYQPVPTQTSSTDSDNLVRSNHTLQREINRLNHNIEIERIKEISKLGSPYTYYQ